MRHRTNRRLGTVALAIALMAGFASPALAGSGSSGDISGSSYWTGSTTNGSTYTTGQASKWVTLQVGNTYYSGQDYVAGSFTGYQCPVDHSAGWNQSFVTCP